jgi:hypothetical protein
MAPPKARGGREYGSQQGKLACKKQELGRKKQELDAKKQELDRLPPELNRLPPELDRLTPELADLPPELGHHLLVMGRREKPADLRELILDLLRWRELSLAQLSVLVDRSQDHVRKAYLNDLIAAEMVQRTNPENPTDPRQTYRATRPEKKQAP